MALTGVSFKWKNSNKPSLGFIAQDVEKILPEIVGTNKKGEKSVQYGTITALLTEAIKEQQHQINQFREEINTIKNELKTLKTQ